MTEQPETIDQRLERLARATDQLRAPSGFTNRVMLAVQTSSSPGWLESVSLSARSALPVVFLAMVAALVLAVQTDRAVTEASAVAYGTMELPW